MAFVKGHDRNKVAPVLSAGTLFLAVIQELQAKGNTFFLKLRVPAKNQITEILDSFKDQRIISWIANNQDTLTGEEYDFNLFMKEFCTLFLNPDWEYDIVGSVLNAKMTITDSFSAYAECVIMGNNLLRGTDYCLDNSGLKNTLTINMTDSLIVRMN